MSCPECRCYGTHHHSGCPNAPEPPKCRCGHGPEDHPDDKHCVECGPAPTNDPSGHSDEPLCVGYDPPEDGLEDE